jgi:hypothetical protein
MRIEYRRPERWHWSGRRKLAQEKESSTGDRRDLINLRRTTITEYRVTDRISLEIALPTLIKL